jgi:transposase
MELVESPEARVELNAIEQALKALSQLREISCRFE